MTVLPPKFQQHAVHCVDEVLFLVLLRVSKAGCELLFSATHPQQAPVQFKTRSIHFQTTGPLARLDLAVTYEDCSEKLLKKINFIKEQKKLHATSSSSSLLDCYTTFGMSVSRVSALLQVSLTAAQYISTFVQQGPGRAAVRSPILFDELHLPTALMSSRRSKDTWRSDESLYSTR